ncbi:MAG: DUF3726 domain-containing protein [Pseudomonadales bacterium]
MRVSSGELLAQLKQSFEAFGASQGEYESAASSVLGLERWGFNGLGLIEGALSRLETDPRRPPHVVFESTDLLIDCFGGSALFGLVPSVERLYVNAWRNNGAQATVKNCREPAFILPLLVKVCERGCNAAVQWWIDGEPQLVHRVRIEGGGGVRVSSQVWEGADVVACDMHVYMSRDAQDLDAVESNAIGPGFKLVQQRGHAEHLACFQRSTVSAIEINPLLWQRLEDIGRKMLVPATVQSRLGAGADAPPQKR